MNYLFKTKQNWLLNIYVDDFGGKRSHCANTGNMKNVYVKEFKCKPGAVGNVVLLSKLAKGSIRLCEVVVYGDKGTNFHNKNKEGLIIFWQKGVFKKLEGMKKCQKKLP